MNKKFILLSLATSMLLADSFELGEVNVQAQTQEIKVFEEDVTAEAISLHTSETVAQALDNVSGVNQDVQGGRGESTIYIRGFDSKRIGVFMDGIPVYVPYDGNFDYGRFLTADTAEIDVSKGYSSVVYGGNTMGGVVNIVSKKPTKELEGNIKAQIIFDSDGKMASHRENINAGTRQKNFYAQLGAVYSKQDHFTMSDKYEATPTQPKGERLRSKSEDKKVSFKAGYVANDKSEIAISYLNQKAVKQQPPVTDTSYAKDKNWDWPYWDKETISLVGQKNFENSYIKALAYYDVSKNSLYSYDNNTFTTISKNWAFKSRYDDYSYGTRLEYGLGLGDNFLKASLNYKKDVHRGYDISKTSDAETMTEQYEDHTISVGLEDSYTISSQFELLVGASYDQRTADKIYDTNTAYLDMLSLATESSLSPQAALIFSPDNSSKVRASISRKTYMPSMKDRYSRKLNSSVPNVDLENEIATHYELSYQKQYNAFSGGLNAYYTVVDDAIQSVVYAPDPAYKQNQNVGSFEHIGGELELNYRGENLTAGGNYAYISIKNTQDSSIKLVDVPKQQLFVFAKEAIGAGFSLYANMKFRSGAYEQKLDGTYVTNPDFTTFDVKAIYQPMKELTAEVGVKNLTDELVRYDMAYPMAGREFFASLEYKF